MSNETLSRILGTALGAAVIIAGLAAFGPKTSIVANDSVAQLTVAPAVSLHASETVTVFSGN